MLEIKNLHAEVDGNKILRGVDLVVRPGEVHAIMGPLTFEFNEELRTGEC